MCTPQCIIGQLGAIAFCEAVKEAGKYVLHYEENLRKLQQEMRDLDDRRESISFKVHLAIDGGEEIIPDVKTWQTEVDRLKFDVDLLFRESTYKGKTHCIAGSYPNIKWRYWLSKQAELKILDIKKVIESSHFDEISHARPPPPELESLSDDTYVNLDSRSQIFNNIVDTLKDSSVNMIGVHGPGGVGKTTLVMEVGKKMGIDGYFKQVSLATISKDIKVEEIQSKLADGLNFNFDLRKGSRKVQLWNKLTNGDKYLIILDDVWEKVDIKAIGIPITDTKKSCKVLLTSRNIDLLLSKMQVQKNFSIAELPEAEAWDLFKKKVGNSFESRPELYNIAFKVVNKCKGLPVAICALGEALKDKPDVVWHDALVKLERYEVMNIADFDSSALAPLLRLSYHSLGSSIAKSCFLLCCLFHEDAEIPIGELTRHCLARRMLSPNPCTLEEVRNYVCTVIDALKSASLLSNGSHENVVRMKNIVRDVGISIAREEEAFLLEHGAIHWPKNPIDGPSYSAILISGKIEALPTKLKCPNLHTLMFENSELSDLEVPDEFFSGMTQLSVLILTRIRMRKLPSSLGKLANLRMLYLIECDLADIATLGDLNKNLEVLSLRGSNIEALPPKIGQLTSLRALDLEYCNKLKVIPQGVVSKLTSLEELFFPDTFYEGEAITDKKQETSNNNVSLEELRWYLSTGQLTTLHINIPHVMFLPKESLMFENLKRFSISVGPNLKMNDNCRKRKVLKHEGYSLRNVLIPLENDAEVLYVSCIKGLKNVLCNGGVRNVYLDMEYLLYEPKCIPERHELHLLQLFSKLIVLHITECNSKYLLSYSTSRELVHLEELIVQSCKVMEEIVGFEEQNDEDEVTCEVKFRKLKRMVLKLLPNLSRFAEQEKMGTTTGSSSARAQPLFNEKVIFPVLEVFEVDGLDKIVEIWDKQSPLSENTVSCCKLRNMKVQHCKKLTNFVPSNVLPRLQNLEKLCVEGCPNIKFVVFKNGKEQEAADDNTLVLPQLRHLTISDMENLESFYSTSTISNAQSLFNYQVIFPVLEVFEVDGLDKIVEIWDKQSLEVFEVDESDKIVEISDNQSFSSENTVSCCKLRNMKVQHCKKLTNLVPSNILPRLQNLEKLCVEGCPNIKFVVFKNGKEKETTDDNTLVIPQLRHLTISDMENLESFYSSSTASNVHSLFNYQVIFPVLEVFEVDGLDKIVEIWDKQSLEVFEVDELDRVEISDKQSPSSENTLSCSKLRNMKVQHCKKLTNLVPSNILPRLEKLCVEGCPNIKFVVFRNGKEQEASDDNTLVIPQLRHLTISDMENLESFYYNSTASNAQSLFNYQVIFPVLEVFEVDRLDKIVEIWDEQSPLSENTVSFCELRNMKVQHCKKLMNLVPTNILPRLQNLQKLCVEGCPNIKFVVFKNGKEQETADDNTLVIPQLRYLTISDVENLESFYTSSTASNAQSLFNYQVKFPKLENLELEGLQNMDNIWGTEYPTSSLSKLKFLKAKRCVKLKNIFRPSMAEVFVNLQELIINDCSKMEAVVDGEVIDREEEVEDGQRRKTDETPFPYFSKLELRCLPEMMRVCQFTRPLKLPRLSQMVIEVCPRLNSFSSGRVSFPKLLSRDVSYDFAGNDTTVTEEEEPSKMA